MITKDLVIIGGGPAGLAAAISASQQGIRDILILERDQYLGGILNQCIHPGFGLQYFKEELTGPEYAERFIQILSGMNIEVSLRSFVINLTKEKLLTYLKPGAMEQIQAKAIIMATGCRERTREMIQIPGSRPAGIFPAGLAQKLINMEGCLPGREVVVIGSGDIGLIMARRFTLEGAQVKAVFEIQPQCRGLVRNVVQCLEDFDIPLYLNHTVTMVHGRGRVERVTVSKVDEHMEKIPGTEFDISCDTVLVSVGLIPENELLEMAGASIDQRTNSPVSDKINGTSIEGVFACGNCYKVYDLVDSVTKDSSLAGQMAAAWIQERS